MEAARPRLLDQVREAIRARHYSRRTEAKYPNASTDWAWQFVFPAARICRDPRWGAPSRFHLHESAVQREVAKAAGRAGTAPAACLAVAGL